jgi:hypothetical protein
MPEQQQIGLRLIEGRQVNVALRDGTRIDDCNLVSSGRNCVDNLWLFTNGEDVIVALDDVIDVWERTTTDPTKALPCGRDRRTTARRLLGGRPPGCTTAASLARVSLAARAAGAGGDNSPPAAPEARRSST